MNDLGSVKKKVRSLIGDVTGDFTTDAYLLPLINQVYGDQVLQLMANTGSSFDEEVRDVPNVPIGTTSLANWQASQMALEDGTTTTGPLCGLITPIAVEWKILGQPDYCYVEARRTGKLPNVSPLAPARPFSAQWEWRGGVVYLTPLSYPTDMRVRGEYGPPPLLQDSDYLEVHPMMWVAVAFGTAAIIGAERPNPEWVKSYSAEASEKLDNIESILIRAEQGTTSRVGRLTSRWRVYR